MFKIFIAVGICFWFAAVLFIILWAKENDIHAQSFVTGLSSADFIDKKLDSAAVHADHASVSSEAEKVNKATAIPELKILAPENPKLVLIVDDIGRDLESLNALAKLNLALTISILPFQKYSREASFIAKSNGWEVMLHLPMEPLNLQENDPGEGALMANMPEAKMRASLIELFQSIPNLKGFNNHMGSRLTTMRDKMEIVMNEAKKYHLFFVDSLTTEKSVAFEVALKAGIPAAERTMFLDNVENEEIIMQKLKKIIEIAENKGFAIAICHSHPETLKVLSRLHSMIANTKIIHASDIISTKENQIYLAHLLPSPHKS